MMMMMMTPELRHDLARTSRCNRLLEVCCLHPSCDTDESPTRPTRPGTRTGPEPPTEPEPPTPGTCGKRNKDGIVQAQNLKVKYMELHLSQTNMSMENT